MAFALRHLVWARSAGARKPAAMISIDSTTPSCPAGGNFFDSAHVYAFWLPNGTGASERAGRNRPTPGRSRSRHPRHQGRPSQHTQRLSTARSLSCAGSCRARHRLKVSIGSAWIRSICIFLHRDDPRVPVGELIDLLNEHIARPTSADPREQLDKLAPSPPPTNTPPLMATPASSPTRRNSAWPCQFPRRIRPFRRSRRPTSNGTRAPA